MDADKLDKCVCEKKKKKKNTQKKTHTQIINNFCSEKLAINKLNSMVVPLRANTVSLFNNLGVCGRIRDKNCDTSALLLKRPQVNSNQIKSNVVF